jgi:hypothetical protein
MSEYTRQIIQPMQVSDTNRGGKGCVGSGEVSGDDRKVFKAIKQMKKRKKWGDMFIRGLLFQ